VKRAWWIPILIIVGFGLWMGFYPVDWQNWLGFSKDAYFVTGQNYAFLSGLGPCLITGLGLSTLVLGLWHHLNCHTDGCPRIVRHKIANGEYGVCGRHWREINGHTPGEKYTVTHLRDRHREHLRATGRSSGISS
jgi:hypothetical protein